MPSASNAPSVAQRIARFATTFDASTLEPAHRDICARTLADTYAVAFAGQGEPAVHAALRYLHGGGLLHDDGGPGRARLWGRGAWAAAETAAWFNGVAGHVLDYDDVNVAQRGHPSVVLWPALLALAQARGLDGERLHASYVVGLEVLVKLSRAFAPEHYAAGWHSTASIGVLGATTACAYLLRLDAGQIAHALGLAVAQAAGSRENVGTQAKCFQAGQAGGAAVRAALLAAAGFEAGAHAIDGPHGYLRTYADGASADAWLALFGEAPLEIERSGLDIKQYPMCYATHRAIDAMLDLRAAHDLRLQDIARVDVLGSPGAFVPLVHPRPANGLQGKFSLPYAMAAAAEDGAVRLASFTDTAVRRPQIQRFFDRVHWQEETGDIGARMAEVRLLLRDGRRLAQRVELLRGSAQRPLDEPQFVAKLDDCLHWGGAQPDGQAGLRLLRHCEALPGMRAQAWAQALDALHPVQESHQGETNP